MPRTPTVKRRREGAARSVDALMFDPVRLPAMAAADGDALAARVEDAGLNAVQPPEQLLYDGWLLRYSAGKARRARSVNAVAEGRLALPMKIDRCRELYAQAGLPCLFRITPFSRPVNLDQELARQGFVAEDETRVMALELHEPPDPVEHRFREIDSDEFAQQAGELRGSPPPQVRAHAARMAASPPLLRARRLALFDGGRIIAVGQSVQECGLVGLYDIITAESTRRRGLATALTVELLRRAFDDRATVAYLQVSLDNIAARRVYSRVGFVDRYAYWYRAEHAVKLPPVV